MFLGEKNNSDENAKKLIEKNSPPACSVGFLISPERATVLSLRNSWCCRFGQQFSGEYPVSLLRGSPKITNFNLFPESFNRNSEKYYQLSLPMLKSEYYGNRSIGRYLGRNF